MRKATTLTLAVALLALSASHSGALPIVGASASTIPRGTFMFDTWGTWQNYTMFYENGGDTPGWRSIDPGFEATSGSFVPRVYYGLTDWITVRAALPLEDRYVLQPGFEAGKSNTGLGDIIIDPKIRLTKGENGFPRVALLTGIRLPTGESNGVDNSVVAPLSDGSTDYMVGAALTQLSPPVAAHLAACYWINGRRDDGVRGSNYWVGLVSLESDIDESWTLLWEFKGVFSEPEVGYYRTYACPGIEWRGERVTVGFAGVISLTGSGGAGPSAYEFDWAPYFRIYYTLF
jgi:hypothetical protein